MTLKEWFREADTVKATDKEIKRAIENYCALKNSLLQIGEEIEKLLKEAGEHKKELGSLKKFFKANNIAIEKYVKDDGNRSTKVDEYA